jgi:hypothetical protein
MKRILLSIVAVAIASTASAQYSISQTRTPSAQSSLIIGPRYTNYSTDVDVGLFTVKSGRQSAIGFSGEYRSGVFVLDFMADHDPENGVSFADLIPLDLANYERDRGELTIGYAALPFLDLQAGARLDSISVGGSVTGIFNGIDVDHQALVAGVKIHSEDMRRFGAYGLARGYVGSAKTDDLGVRTNADTTGWRVEGGLMIPVGDSSWAVVPAVEYEHIEANDLGLKLDTNRFLLGFVYRSGK